MDKKEIVKEIEVYLQKYFIPVFNRKLFENGFKIQGIYDFEFEEESIENITKRDSLSTWIFKANANLERSDFTSKIRTSAKYEFVGNVVIETYKNATSDDLISHAISVEITCLKEIQTK